MTRRNTGAALAGEDAAEPNIGAGFAGEGAIIKGFDAKRSGLSVLRRPEVEARTGLSRSTIYEWMRHGKFPRPIALGTRCVAWRQSDVDEWLRARETKAG